MVSDNVLALGEEADFEALNCLPALKLIRSTKLQLSTEPAFFQTPVSGSGFFHSSGLLVNNAIVITRFSAVVGQFL